MEEWLKNSEGYIVLLFRASDIPDKSVVRRPKGRVFYTLRTSLTIYHDPSPEGRRTLYAADNTRLLVSNSGDADAIDGNKAMVWYATPEQLLTWITARVNKQDSVSYDDGIPY